MEVLQTLEMKYRSIDTIKQLICEILMDVDMSASSSPNCLSVPLLQNRRSSSSLRTVVDPQPCSPYFFLVFMFFVFFAL